MLANVYNVERNGIINPLVLPKGYEYSPATSSDLELWTIVGVVLAALLLLKAIKP